jgi:hypothetical protein
VALPTDRTARSLRGRNARRHAGPSRTLKVRI